jgi:hypothetical protein
MYVAGMVLRGWVGCCHDGMSSMPAEMAGVTKRIFGEHWRCIVARRAYAQLCRHTLLCFFFPTLLDAGGWRLGWRNAMIPLW